MNEEGNKMHGSEGGEESNEKNAVILADVDIDAVDDSGIDDDVRVVVHDVDIDDDMDVVVG